MANKLSSLLSLFYCQQTRVVHRRSQATQKHIWMRTWWEGMFLPGLRAQHCPKQKQIGSSAPLLLQRNSEQPVLNGSLCVSLDLCTNILLCTVCHMILYSDWRLVHFIKKKSVCGSCDPEGISLQGKNQWVSPVWCLFTANCYHVSVLSQLLQFSLRPSQWKHSWIWSCSFKLSFNFPEMLYFYFFVKIFRKIYKILNIILYIIIILSYYILLYIKFHSHSSQCHPSLPLDQ